MLSLTINEMRLTANARIAAEMILAKHPKVRFTSGRRSSQAQARAMAANTCRHGINWLAQTYKDQRMVKCLMAHVSENPDQLNNSELLAACFHELLLEHFSNYFARMPHIKGRAFDIGWPRGVSGLIIREEGEAICKTIEELPAELGLELLLKKEGAHEVIHAQFATPLEEIKV